MFTHARRVLDGPHPTLPRRLDRISERWWAARPRTRVVIATGLLVLLLLAVVTRIVVSPHGPPAVAWVATRDLAVGEELDRSALRRVSWPGPLLPAGSLTEPTGTLVAPLPRGAVATDRHLGDLGAIAGVDADRALVPIPLESLPALPIGARVDIVVTDGHELHGRTVARDALVLRDDGSAWWLAVAGAEANDLAGAALQGSLGVVLIPP